MRKLKQRIKKRLSLFSTIAFAFLLFLYPQTILASTAEAPPISEYINLEGGVGEKIEAFGGTFGIFINGVMGLSVMTGVLVMIVLAVKLGAASNAPMMRTMVVRKMIVAGICTACLGSVMLIYNLILAIVF